MKGVYLETNADGVSGMFFATDRAERIAAASRRFERDGIQRSPAELHAGMMNHSSARFRERYKALVDATIAAEHAQD